MRTTEESVLRTPSRFRTLAILCLIFLATPNFNIIDVFPDFIAYIILARFFGRYKEYAPYFAEANESFTKLAIITAAKLPASLVMITNIGSGQDIVPLFTAVFMALELMFLFPAVSSAFSAIYYVGERGELSTAIRPFRYLGKATDPDSPRMLSYIFVSVKAVFTLIPDMLLLTPVAETTAEQLKALYLRSLFPIVTVISCSIVLILGIFWAVMLYKYSAPIAKEGDLGDKTRAIAGEARLKAIAGEREVKRVIATMTLLLVSCVLCFDVTFSGLNGGINVLPHCLYALFIIFVSTRTSGSHALKTTILVSGIAYSSASTFAHLKLIAFTDLYYFGDLGRVSAADAAYLTVEMLFVLELVLFAVFAVAFARSLVNYVLEHTTLRLGDERYGRQDEEMRRKMRIKTLIFAYFPLFILALKCVEVFLRTDVRYIINAETSAATITTATPWFGFVILGFTVAYLFYAYYFTNEVKDEVRMKYSNEKQSYE